MLKARRPARGLGGNDEAGAVQAGLRTGPMNLPPASRIVPSSVQMCPADFGPGHVTSSAAARRPFLNASTLRRSLADDIFGRPFRPAGHHPPRSTVFRQPYYEKTQKYFQPKAQAVQSACCVRFHASVRRRKIQSLNVHCLLPVPSSSVVAGIIHITYARPRAGPASPPAGGSSGISRARSPPHGDQARWRNCGSFRPLGRFTFSPSVIWWRMPPTLPPITAAPFHIASVTVRPNPSPRARRGLTQDREQVEYGDVPQCGQIWRRRKCQYSSCGLFLPSS
jgi:hypothetical protein